ncbi:hypothetical protein Psuf_001130 [Phytohabitans suffuscus]|uniref:Uncharacterized protein n=1 Tax=Phytohabitans suffuscus TaxID=624315 RepID=A0A6F8Y9R6_9ACTN|nr:hypothetical protein Psuf_001130 [Phytohabitans suffuscus]
MGYRDVRRGPDRCSRGLALRVTRPDPAFQAAGRVWSRPVWAGSVVDQGLWCDTPVDTPTKSLINARWVCETEGEAAGATVWTTAEVAVAQSSLTATDHGDPLEQIV